MSLLMTYLLMNVCICISYFAFCVLLKVSAPPLLMARLGLALLAISIRAPAFMSLAPTRALPSLPIALRDPLPELSDRIQPIVRAAVGAAAHSRPGAGQGWHRPGPAGASFFSC